MSARRTCAGDVLPTRGATSGSAALGERACSTQYTLLVELPIETLSRCKDREARIWSVSQ